MSDPSRALARCLQAVFPDLTDDEVAEASVDTVPDWDSLHALMLVAVIEEVFDVRIPARDYPRLRSHDQLLAYLSPTPSRPVQ